MRHKSYTIVLECDPSHRGAYKWSAYCPALPGCVSDGRSRQEALRNIREAIPGYLEAAGKAGIKRSPRVEVVEVVA